MNDDPQELARQVARLAPLIGSPALLALEAERDASRAAERTKLLGELDQARRLAEKASAARAREFAAAEQKVAIAEIALRDANRRVRELYSRNFGLDHVAATAFSRIEAKLAELGEDAIETAILDVGRIRGNAHCATDYKDVRSRDFLGRWKHEGAVPTNSGAVAHAATCDALIDELKALRESPLSPAEIEARCLGARRKARAGMPGERPVEEVSP